MTAKYLHGYRNANALERGFSSGVFSANAITGHCHGATSNAVHPRKVSGERRDGDRPPGQQNVCTASNNVDLFM